MFNTLKCSTLGVEHMVVQKMSFKLKNTWCLYYIFNDKSEVLLIYKKRGFGEGRWNAPGGKIGKDETIKKTAQRETHEETGIKPLNLKKVGYIEFVFNHNPESNNKCYIFSTKDFQGDLIESEECLPKWFSLTEIPYEEMWDDDRFWLPQLLENKGYIKKRFFFGENDKVIKHEDL